MKIQFTKMHGLGNDFMVVDATHKKLLLSSQQIQQLAHRHTGIGFDQLLIIEKSSHPRADFFYRIYNADGSEVAQCGNGARCLARFIEYHQLSNKKHLVVETRAGLLALNLLDNNLVAVNMGIPNFTPAQIPFTASTQQQVTYSLAYDATHIISASVLSLGNPHCVTLCENIATAPVATLGKILSTHTYFPEGVNVGFMQVLTPQHIALRVYERGVGETHACGSGACAAVVAGIQQQLLSNQVTVDLPGGSLCIEWPGANEPVTMIGPATIVYIGETLKED
jgi:diaminopimelate epimerase